jgi:two-component system, NtrC family, sensor histidine kinase HydH
MQTAPTSARSPQPGRPPIARVGPWPVSLAGRLVLFAIFLVSVTILLIGTLSYSRARRALEINARTALALAARDVASDFRLELSDVSSDIRNWSRLEVMRAILYMDVDKQLADFLRQVTEGRDTFRAMVVFDQSGRVVARRGEIRFASAPAQPSEARLVIARAPAGGGVPFVTIEAPVPYPNHTPAVMGTILVVLDPAALLDKLTAMALGPHRKLAVSLREIDGPTLARSGPGMDLDDIAADADRWILGRSKVPAVPDLALPPLEILVGDTVESALAPVVALRLQVLRVGLLALLAASALGALVAWRIGRPIRELTAEITAISESGNLDAEIHVGDARGEVGVLLSAFRDMLRSLSDVQARAVAQSRLALLGEIAANVAHEVRTPLSVMKTSAQLLARGQTPPEERDRLVRMIGDEVDRLNSVVTDLVDIARPKAVVYADEALVPIVLRAMTLCEAFAERAAVAIEKDIADDTLRVRCSADQIYQVVLNLLRNALQAVESGGRITVRVGSHDGWAALDVDDTGPGFTADALEKAFSPFFTTKNGGAGLGLAIAARIVEEHGGSIRAGNLPSGGARVSVRLSLG